MPAIIVDNLPALLGMSPKVSIPRLGEPPAAFRIQAVAAADNEMDDEVV
jgi:hypothetical protein